MTLFENFNTSNQTSPLFEKHENFVINLKSPGCALAQTFDYDDRCSFVQKTEKCREDILLLDYTNIFYCILGPQNGYEEFGCIVFFAIFVYLLMGFVGTATDQFFCPPLKYITNVLGISENLAGITLLTFGNSAPDLVSNLVGMTEDVGTVYSDSVGSAMFITAAIAGSIIVMGPFHVEGTAFVRDISFQMLAIVYIDYAIRSDRHVTIAECVVMLCMYPAYFTIIMVDQYLLVRTIRNLTSKYKDENDVSGMNTDRYNSFSNISMEVQSLYTEKDANRLRQLQKEAGIDIAIKPRLRTIPAYVKPADFEASHANDLLFWQLLDSLMPIDLDQWRQAEFSKRICMLLQAPIDLILFALLPAVDHNREITGWSKLLNCIQVPLMPVVLLLLTAGDVTLFGYPLPLFSLFFTVPLAVLTFMVTRTDRAPPFHLIFAIFSITGSIILIRVFTRELINIINVLGMVTYVSQSFLGCTVESWGNSIGDLVASVDLAKQGYQKMGLASCIAGPLFYLTLQLGCIYLYKCIVNEETHIFEATQGSMGENCTVFLMTTLTGMLFSGVMTNFYLRRNVGAFLLLQYFLFCFYCLLGEFQLIHPFGTDHTEDYGIAFL